MKYTEDQLKKIRSALLAILSADCDAPPGEWQLEMTRDALQCDALIDCVEQTGGRIIQDVYRERLNEFGEYRLLNELHWQYRALIERLFEMAFNYGVRIGQGEDVPDGVKNLGEGIF